MITKYLLGALENIGFTSVFNDNKVCTHCYAIYGDYLISAYEEGNRKIAFFSFRFPESEENDVKRYEISEAFSGIAEDYSVVDYNIEDNGMKIACNGNAVDFIKLLDACIKLLNEYGIRGAGYCSVCGNKFGTRNPKKVTYGCDEQLMCEHCAMEALEEYDKQEAEEDQPEKSKGKTVFGILGSVVFSLIGVFLYFAAYYWIAPALAKSGVNDIRYVLCVLGAAVAVLAFAGYRLFCKKTNAAAYITTAAVPLLFTAIGQYIGSVFGYIANNGFGISALSKKAFWLIHLRSTVPDDIADQFENHSASFYRLLALSLVFAAVCIAIALLTLHDKSKTKKEPLRIVTLNIKN